MYIHVCMCVVCFVCVLCQLLPFFWAPQWSSIAKSNLRLLVQHSDEEMPLDSHARCAAELRTYTLECLPHVTKLLLLWHAGEPHVNPKLRVPLDRE